jgi:hypothetical protein
MEDVTHLHGTTLEIVTMEEGFCWDHGYFLGPHCPRCRRETNGSPSLDR